MSKLIKSGLLIFWISISTVPEASSDALQAARKDALRAIDIAGVYISESEQCVEKRNSVEPGILEAYVEPCLEASNAHNVYKDQFEKALIGTDLLLNRGKKMLLRGNGSGEELIDLTEELFFWNDRAQLQFKREAEALGFCYGVMIATGLILPKCCGEFKADGLNPPVCNN